MAHAFAGDDAGLIVRAEASRGEVAGDLDRPLLMASRAQAIFLPSSTLPSAPSSLARYASEPPPT